MNRQYICIGVTLLPLFILLSSGGLAQDAVVISIPDNLTAETPLARMPVLASPTNAPAGDCNHDASLQASGGDREGRAPCTRSLPARAFPGAEGYGSETPGGRGGQVLVVTSLIDNNDKGTLRWAINRPGRRLVIFKTGGLIKLKKRLVIKNPYITIAGQTAPGSGITLGGGQQFAIRTHDVIIRGLRSRPGDGPGALGSQRDALSIGRSYNVVIDHCSFSWATDENISIWFAARDITLSWNIIAQALADSIHEKGTHSMGMIVGDNSHRISIHKNLFASNLDRNPLLKNAYHIELINNYIYGWGDGGVKVYRNSSAASSGKPVLYAVGNFLHHGSRSLPRPGIEIRGDSPVYLSDNIDTVFRTNHNADEFSVAHKENQQLTTALAQYSNKPHFRQSGIFVENTQYVQDFVLNNAGTSNNQHPIDANIIRSIKQGSAKPIDSVRQMGGYGENSRGTAANDSDGDGMPDWFEKKLGFRFSEIDANGDADGDGYTNIEEYINSYYE